MLVFSVLPWCVSVSVSRWVHTLCALRSSLRQLIIRSFFVVRSFSCLNVPFLLSLLSQGMNAAGFLLFVTKRELLDPTFIVVNIIFGSIGVIIGLSITSSAEVINLVYTVVVFEFAILYFYKNVYASDDEIGGQKSSNGQKVEMSAKNRVDSEMEGKTTIDIIETALSTLSTLKPPIKSVPMWIYVCMALGAVLGGFVTANVGSGSDIMLYAYGIFVWNKFVPMNRRRGDHSLTASSVVVMGCMSLLTACCRALSSVPITHRTMLTWGAMAWVVVIGAPVGSLVLTPACVPYLRMMFYFLAVVQLVLFGLLKIQGNITAWVVIIVLTVVQLTALSTTYFTCGKGRGKCGACSKK